MRRKDVCTGTRAKLYEPFIRQRAEGSHDNALVDSEFPREQAH
jgi:hypothetical protein